MGYILSLQELERRDGQLRDAELVSYASASICRSSASSTVC
ncbi:hypothetical protein [Microbacterium sp. cf332]|nr:hypothetical protein [Microbacterium sp. cf332]SDQ56296.1 hypothetical protein SAMN04487847_1868 [Microbacterium sp. cf332]